LIQLPFIFSTEKEKVPELDRASSLRKILNMIYIFVQLLLILSEAKEKKYKNGEQMM